MVITTELLQPGTNSFFLLEKCSKKYSLVVSLYGQAYLFSLGLNEFILLSFPQYKKHPFAFVFGEACFLLMSPYSFFHCRESPSLSFTTK